MSSHPVFQEFLGYFWPFSIKNQVLQKFVSRFSLELYYNSNLQVTLGRIGIFSMLKFLNQEHGVRAGGVLKW
jgi:hypothetical protein